MSGALSHTVGLTKEENDALASTPDRLELLTAVLDRTITQTIAACRKHWLDAPRAPVAPAPTVVAVEHTPARETRLSIERDAAGRIVGARTSTVDAPVASEVRA